jgi:hypothetical protein
MALSKKMSDFSYMIRSGTIIPTATGEVDLFSVPKNAFVEELWLSIVTADADTTVKVGFKGNGETADDDAFIDVILGVGDSIAMIKATDDAQPASKGKWFNTANAIITATVGGTLAPTLTFRVFCKYSIIS